MSGYEPVAYARRRPCGCVLDVADSLDALPGLRRVSLLGVSLQALLPTDAAALPAACDACAPTRQERLL